MTDFENGYAIFTLHRPLMPGETTTLTFTDRAGVRGFSDDPGEGRFVRNGTVLLGQDAEIFPQVGYRAALELTDPGLRKRFNLGLPRAEETPALPQWIAFRAAVSTDVDQTPVASGRMVKTWTNAERRHAVFESDHDVTRAFVVASGAYARRVRQIGPVEVEILYHPPHATNLESMFRGARCALDYGARNFRPYPHRTLRIVEVPMYTLGANARAMSTILLSGEYGGFITDVTRGDVDRVFSTAAHETAHQWWGDGIRTMNEVLTDYVRTSCIEQTAGRDPMVNFLRETRRRYFRGRDHARDTARLESERSLVDGGQYDSDYVLMWRLRHLLGAGVVNAALRDVMHEFDYRRDRIPVPANVYGAVLKRTPAAMRPVVADIFERITIHHVRAQSAEAFPLGENRYRVAFVAAVPKSYAGPDGVERAAPRAGYVDFIDVAVRGTKEEMLSLATYRVNGPELRAQIVVNGRPATVEVDPLVTLLDPGEENRIAVRERGQKGGSRPGEGRASTVYPLTSASVPPAPGDARAPRLPTHRIRRPV